MTLYTRRKFYLTFLRGGKRIKGDADVSVSHKMFDPVLRTECVLLRGGHLLFKYGFSGDLFGQYHRCEFQFVTKKRPVPDTQQKNGAIEKKLLLN